MTTNGLEINSIAIEMKNLETILKGEGSPTGVLAALEFLKKAVEEKKPIYV